MRFLRAASVLAERRRSWGFATPEAGFATPEAGASSNMTWQFVPERPKELMPARRGIFSSVRIQGMSLVLTMTGELSQSILRLGSLKWIEGGICLYLRARQVLMRPTRPEASAVCPRFDLTEPIRQKVFSGVYLRKAFVIPSISMGSPNLVPVPWASI